MMQYLNIALIAALGAFSSQAMAFSVWDRPTDDFVCDFSPWTSSKLTQKTNVPDGISDEEAIYVRLALRVAASNCKDGQVLILHSALGSDFDSRYFRTLANHLCLAADVSEKTIPTKDLPNAFEVRCRIAKMAIAREFITKVEAEKPTEAVILENYRRSRSSAASNTPSGQADRKDTKLCVGQVIGFGGGCK
jgi:hypothetical protein